MRLPHYLSDAIQQEIEQIDRAALVKASAELTEHYKSGHFSGTAMKTAAHRAAYLAVRFPATFAANWHAFSELRRLAQQAKISSILDLGTGPGTALYAAAEIFPDLAQATLIDADESLLAIGERLGRASSNPAIRGAQWLRRDLKKGLDCKPDDLLVISYSLGEFPSAIAREILLQAWKCARQFLVIVEPGTTRGFGVVHAARQQLIATGAYILAPCPHAAACPMAAAGDWCHFAARLARTSLHRQIKGGVMGHEDEKFSYVVASRQEFLRPNARIVRHPQKRSGHVRLLLCMLQGLRSEIIGKSKERYKDARAAEWGDPWDDIPAK